MYNEIGTYQVVLLAENAEGCSDSETITITAEEAAVSTSELEQNQNVEVFPNPGMGIFNLWYKFDHFYTFDIKLTDMMGRNIAEFPQGRQKEGNLILDLQSYPNGVYLLVCHLNDQKIIKKLIKM